MLRYLPKNKNSKTGIYFSISISFDSKDTTDLLDILPPDHHETDMKPVS